MAGAARVSLPLLVLYGTEDQVVDVAFIEALYERVSSRTRASCVTRATITSASTRPAARRCSAISAWLGVRLPGAV